MGTLKKFWKYFLLFIVMFAIIGGLTSLAMRENFEEMANYEIIGKSPIVTVTESKSANTHGYIKGTVTNDTEDIIPLKYVKINLYDKNEIYLGSEYREIKNFYPKETINFNINYRYNNVGKIVLGLTNEKTDDEIYNFFSDIEDDDLKIALPIAGFLVLYTVLP